MNKIIKKVTWLIFILTLIICINNKVYANDDVRAVWISTVYNLDYPKTKGVANQKEEYIKLLDKLQETGINKVVVQVRPKADALYSSKINPWSDVLTGVQGMYPGYDPLEFMVEEAHKRGMSFHAWLNPYRITTSGTNLEDLSFNHLARKHPEYTITHSIGNGKEALCYNPALTKVKEHIADTVEEIILNYDVDGIHFDDYFYPANYPLPEGETIDGIIADKRREHVNDMVEMVSDRIKKSGKKVKFGISPMGIWKNKSMDITGSNTNGKQSYYHVYSDTRKWIKDGLIDYVVPQIYWEIGHSLADYKTLVAWWNTEVNNTGVDLYIGQGIYKDIVSKEIDKQLELNKKYKNIKGSFFFSMRDITNNRMGVQDKLRQQFNIVNKEEKEDDKDVVEIKNSTLINYGNTGNLKR